MVTAAIYSRKSKFTGKGESIQNQIQLCKEYAKKNYRVEDFIIYEDEGFSGGHIQRPQYTKMIQDISKGKFDLLICYRLDRISRNISDFSNLMELLQEHNIDFVSIREQFDTSIPMGRAMMYISSVFAQLERETIAERIRDNMYQLAKTGRWLGGRTPMGFESKQVHYLDDQQVQRKVYQLIPIERELNLVKVLYQKYMELGSLTKLESWTLEKGIKTRRHNNFDKSALKIILSNPVYAIADKELYDYFFYKNAHLPSSIGDFDGVHGLMVFNKHDESKKTKILRKDESQWIVAVGKHKGIIPSKEWIQVQKILENNRQKAPRSGTGKYGLITRLLRCNQCGSKMRVSVYKRDTGIYYYYKCLLKERSRGTLCSVINLNGKLADQEVVNHIKKIEYNKDFLYGQLKPILHLKGNIPINLSYPQKQLEEQLTNYHRYINNLTLQLAETKDLKAGKYIIHKIEEFHRKILQTESQLEKIKNINKDRGGETIHMDSVMNFIENFTKDMDRLPLEEKKRILYSLIQEIGWDGKKLKIIYKKN